MILVYTSVASRMLQNFSLLIKENIFISKCHLVIFRYYSSFVTNRAENTEMNYEKEKSKELGAKKNLFFPKNLQVFFDKKIPMLAVVVYYYCNCNLVFGKWGSNIQNGFLLKFVCFR